MLRKKVNAFRANTSGGPLELYENDEIVRISMYSGNTGLDKVIYEKKRKQKRLPLIHYQFVKILNSLYIKRKI